MSKPFPTAGLVPKAETRADEFLQRFPTYDGRNTVVAILDTGVDVGAIGLQTTSDGKPKIVDVLDATGAGDVDTSLVLQASGGKLALPGGKVLSLNPSWPQDGAYHHGTLVAFDLFPKLLVDRLKKERKEKFDEQQRAAVATVQQALAQWTQTHGSSSAVDAAAVRAKKELLARAAQLDALDKSYRDVGPVYDAVVFFDGAHWRAALDTNEDGDLTLADALTNYRVERQHATFSAASQYNYALNIYDEGKTLSVVCDAGAHGTHVAGIVAAHHPEQPLCHGVAPGAQIVSVKIGDARLGSMETSPALVRAVLAMMQWKVDVVNMSYGEYASEHGAGRIVELVTELVDEHGVVFVCSAGNNGPALGTVGSPGGTTSALLSVGAYVSPQMMQAEYIMRESNDYDAGLTYTWSSRGVTFDGDVGVNVCAPGAAITTVPTWTLNKKQLMNGTSMSSPNCAGVVALLVSALKHRGVAYTPYSLRHALERTAAPLPEVERFAQGHGLVQVVPAFEWLEKNGNQFEGTKEQPLCYRVTANCGGYAAARGVFLRDAAEFAHASTEVTVSVTPVFHKHANPRSKVEFEQHVRLVPSKRWVAAGSALALLHEGRSFKVLLETQHLAAGVVHTAEVKGYAGDSNRVLFTVPVTVIKPEVVTKRTLSYPVPLRPGAIARKFVSPPVSATYADVVLSRGADASDGSAKLYMLHVLQFAPFVRQSQSSFQKAFLLKPGDQAVFSLDIVGGLTAELCLAQFWSALGDSEVTLEVHFHGIVPDQRKVTLTSEAQKVLLWSDLQREVVAPSVTFTKWTQRLRPTASVTSPLSSTRDKLPRERQLYELVLTYQFVTKESNLSVTPRLPLLHGRLYESPFEAQMAMVFDHNKRYVGASDALGDAVNLNAKGTYTVKAQVRHEDLGKLERLKNMVLEAEFGIKELAAPVYAHQDDAALGRKQMGEATLALSKHLAVFLGEPAFDKLPSGAQPGDVLTGTVYYGKKNGGVVGAGRRPSGFPVSYVVPPAPSPAAKELPDPVDPVEKEKENEKENKDEQKEENDAVRDLLLGRLQKLAGKPAFDAVYERLLKQYPAHLPLLQAQLHHADHASHRATNLTKVVEAADAVVALIHQDDLARFFGTRATPADKEKKKEKENEKDILVDALARKARALGDAAQWTEFLDAHRALEQWADVDATSKLVHVALLHDCHHAAWGLALQRLRKLADLDAAEREKIMTEDALAAEIQTTLGQLDWAHWSQLERQAARVKAPRTYRKF